MRRFATFFLAVTFAVLVTYAGSGTSQPDRTHLVQILRSNFPGAKLISVDETFVLHGNLSTGPQAESGVGELAAKRFIASYAKQLGLDGDAAQHLVVKEILPARLDPAGHTVVRLQQTLNGIPVEHGELIVHIDGSGVIRAVSGSYLNNVQAQTTPSLSAEAAIDIAQREIAWSALMQKSATSGIDGGQDEVLPEDFARGGSTYGGDLPSAKLEVIRRNSRDYLVWHTDIFVASPEPARWEYYIDAHTGAIIDRLNTLETGSGPSLYSGTVAINTYQSGSYYYMGDQVRNLYTYDAKNRKTLPGYLFSDANDYWDGSRQRAGVDAHFNAAETYDFYKTSFGRDGIDNKHYLTKSSVHYGLNYNNAFWNGSQMAYGDGDGTTFSPLVSMDVTAHELTHGVTQYTANLTYSYEPGALNEAISDIFGTCVEFYAYGTSYPRTSGGTGGNWWIGEDCYTPGTYGDALRYMDNPNRGKQPDTYKGTYWYSGTLDNGGVHTNSGVANYAFYLLSVGGSGTNDNGYAFSVPGIGIGKAAQIFYRALTTYFTSSTNYAGARAGTLSAAADLYGSGSAEYNAVAAAWDAVGVGGGLAPSGSVLAQNPSSQQTITAEGLPTTFTVYQNYPNPFNPTTNIRFDLPVQQRVRVEIFNILGQRVRLLVDDDLEAGSHIIQWNARDDNGLNVPTGLYLCRITASNKVYLLKMTLLK